MLDAPIDPVHPVSHVAEPGLQKIPDPSEHGEPVVANPRAIAQVPISFSPNPCARVRAGNAKSAIAARTRDPRWNGFIHPPVNGLGRACQGSLVSPSRAGAATGETRKKEDLLGKRSKSPGNIRSE